MTNFREKIIEFNDKYGCDFIILMSKEGKTRVFVLEEVEFEDENMQKS